MPNSIVARIARDAGIPDLVERLAEELVPTDLQSLLLEVYERRTEASSGEEHELVDGGFTNWTQALFGSRKERLLISGIGCDRLVGVFCPSKSR